MLCDYIASYMMPFDRSPSIGFLTNRAARLLVQSLDARLKRLGMRAAHMPVFLALVGGESLTQKQLAEIAGIEQPTMAGTLSRMEASGLIERHPDPADRRSMLIQLSAEGLARADSVQAVVEDITALAEREFSEGEDALYRTMIGKMISALERDPLRD